MLVALLLVACTLTATLFLYVKDRKEWEKELNRYQRELRVLSGTLQTQGKEVEELEELRKKVRLYEIEQSLPKPSHS